MIKKRIASVRRSAETSRHHPHKTTCLIRRPSLLLLAPALPTCAWCTTLLMVCRGTFTWAVPTAAFAAASPDSEMGSSDLTDGVWLWPEGLAHYVEVHGLPLPEEFIATMKGNSWQPPLELSDKGDGGWTHSSGSNGVFGTPEAHCCRDTMPLNKGMRLTKPSILELRSSSAVAGAIPDLGPPGRTPARSLGPARGMLRGVDPVRRADRTAPWSPRAVAPLARHRPGSGDPGSAAADKP